MPKQQEISSIVKSNCDNDKIIEKIEKNGFEQEKQFFLSAYIDGNVVTNETIVRQVNRLRNCFASQPSGFWSEMMQFIRDANFTDEKLNDCVDNIIKTKTSGFLTIADILQYDKCGKRLYTYEETCKYGNNDLSQRNFLITDIKDKYGKRFWIECTKQEYAEFWKNRKNS